MQVSTPALRTPPRHGPPLPAGYPGHENAAHKPIERQALDMKAYYRFSEHVILQPVREGILAVSLLTGRPLLLGNPSQIRIATALWYPVRLEDLVGNLDRARRNVVMRFVQHVWNLGLLARTDSDGRAESEPEALQAWEIHDLFFHVRSRRGRNPTPVGTTYHLVDEIPPVPAFKDAPDPGDLALARPTAAALESAPRLDEALAARRTSYRTAPLPLDRLGELLYRTCRTSAVVTDRHGEELTRKLYPSGGSLHSLEVYIAAARCPGLPRGLYHYRPREHTLRPVCGFTADVEELLREAQGGAGALPDLPSALFLITARFQRVARKYQSIAYRLILAEVGALYQTLYLVAGAMNLAASAIGAGDSDRFARAAGTDYYHETSVGEFIVGGPESAEEDLPKGAIRRSES